MTNSIATRSRRTLTLSVLSLLLVMLAVSGVLLGNAAISLAQVLSIFNQHLPLPQMFSTDALKPWMESIVFSIRLPRVLVALLAGSTLAVCGAVMQGMFRNPLASPGILGVSSGASLGSVLALYLGLAVTSIWLLPLFAFIGAALSLLLVYRIAGQRGHLAMGTLLLAGVAVGALNAAASSLILAFSLNNWEIGRMIVYWTMGALDGRTWDHVYLLLPFATIGLALVTLFARPLDALMLGEEHALSVGVDVVQTRRILLVVTTAMVGATVAVCGSIGFIGLVVPHIMRLILGPHHRYLLPASALAGAICLLLADISLRLLFPTTEIPIGVATATLGAPFFLFLLVKKRWEVA